MQLRGLSFAGALSDLAVLLSRIAIQQRVPGVLPPDESHLEQIQELAQQLSPDHVQLFYSVVVHSRDELRLAPDEYAGFVMACMRLFALTPAGSLPVAPSVPAPAAAGSVTSSQTDTAVEAAAETKAGPSVVASAEQPRSEPSEAFTPPAPAASVAETQAIAPSSPYETDYENTTREGIQTPSIERGGQVLQAADTTDTPPWEEEATVKANDSDATPALPEAQSNSLEDSDLAPPPYDEEPPFSEMDYEQSYTGDEPDFPAGDIENGNTIPHIEDAVQQAVAALDLAPASIAATPEQITSADWVDLAPKLPLSGWAAELAQQTEWVECDGEQVVLRAAIRSADDSQAKARINTVLNEHFGRVLRLHIEYGSTGEDTAFAVAEAQRAQRQKEAEVDAQQNPFILALVEQFDAQLVSGSVRAK